MPDPRASRIALLSLGYFGLVFAAGFVFGVIRTVYVTPRVGEQTAQIMEAPLLLLATVFAASLIARRSRLAGGDLLIVGATAALFVLCADVLVGVLLRQMSIVDVLLHRDFVTAAVYYSLVIAFAVMPCLLGQYTSRR